MKKYGKFEDADFLAEINKPAKEKAVPVKEFLREEAVVPWQQYSELSDTVHY